MTVLQHKIDFAIVLRVKNANPNGDPLNGNRPRADYAGYGEITDVCLKRKIRDRLLESGQSIFVQSDDRKIDSQPSLRARAESAVDGLGKEAFHFVRRKKKKGSKDDIQEEDPAKKKDETVKRACAKWFDVRAFGQLFAWKDRENKKSDKGTMELEEDDDNSNKVSIPVRGPVTVQSAFSVEPIVITSTQITKSVSGEGDGTKRGADTMGMKHRVDRGVYVSFGSINPQLAERTGFSDEDADTIKAILPRLFENDASSARPEGSMEVLKIVWWKHSCKSGKYSSARVHRSLAVDANGNISPGELPGLPPEIIDGF